MKRIVVCVVLTATLGLMVGCASNTGEGYAGVYTSGANIMEAEELALPANYDPASMDHELTMQVAFKSPQPLSEPNKEVLPISAKLSSRLQTEMKKLGRFKIDSTFNNISGDLVAERADLGEVKQREENVIGPFDLTLSVEMIATRERQRVEDGNEWFYCVECDCNCRDEKTHLSKFAEKFRGEARRHQMMSMRNKRMAGFDEKTAEDALTEAALKALANLAKKLGNEFPVCGKVTGMTPSGETMMFDKGYEQGVFKNQQTVVFVDYMGVDIPIAAGTAEPGKNRSRLAVRRWNEKNKDADAVIKELRSSPVTFFKNYKVYAAGYGIPIPPEWETFDQRK